MKNDKSRKKDIISPHHLKLKINLNIDAGLIMCIENVFSAWYCM